MESRRDFLQKLAAAAVTLALDPFRGVAVAGDIYTNDRLGLSLRKPPGWDYSSIADFAALRDRQVLHELFEDETHPLKDPGNLPVVLIEDPAYRRGHFVPAIALWDEELDGEVPSDQALAHKTVMIDAFAQAYREVKIQEPPAEIQLIGKSGTRSRWTYVHELETGETFHMSIISLVIFVPPRVHTFHLGDDARKPCMPDAVWNDFIRSISYRR